MSNSIKIGMRRFPYAFTELGVAMLSSVLNSKAAIRINMSIMRAFVAIRQLIANPSVDRVGELEKQMQKLRGPTWKKFSLITTTSTRIPECNWK